MGQTPASAAQPQSLTKTGKTNKRNFCLYLVCYLLALLVFHYHTCHRLPRPLQRKDHNFLPVVWRVVFLNI